MPVKNLKLFIIAFSVLLLVFLASSCGKTEIVLPSVNDVTDLTGNAAEGSSDIVLDNTTCTHSGYSEKVIKEATCSSAGYKAMCCDKCGAEKEGSKMILPLLPHTANEATCTEDSVCSSCGKILVLKYGHFEVFEVVTAATCTTEGIERKICHRCGKYEDIIISSSHELDDSVLAVADGNVGSKCVKCNAVVGYAEQEPLLYLQFEDSSELAKYPSFTFTYPNTVSGAAKPSKDVWMGYDVDTVKSYSKYMIAFDFKLTADGHPEKGESLFTLIGGVNHKLEKPGTKQNWVWAIKYYESEGVVATVMQGFNGTNSFKVNKNEWYSFVGIVDNAAKEMKVYINGTYIGKRAIHDYEDQAYGGAFSMRMYDAMPVNGTSDPMFDNLKIVELK